MRALPTRPLPSRNGWIVSNWACAIAAWMTAEEQAVDVEQMLGRELLEITGQRNRTLERRDVGEDALGSQIAAVGGEGRPRQAPVREHETLDP